MWSLLVPLPVFGAHFAELIASAGGKVVLGARRVDKLDALVNRLNTAGGEALALALDVRDPASAQGLFGQCRSGLWSY